MSQKPLGFQADERYRTVAEARVVDMFHFAGWAMDRESVGRTAAVQALAGWIELGLPFRQTGGARFFDTVEVLNFAKQASLDGKDNFWRDRLVTTARQLAQSLPNEPHGFRVDCKRTFHIQLSAGHPLRLRMPLPLESQHLQELEVEPFSDTEARLTVTRGRLEARLAARGSDTVTIGARLSLTAGPRAGDGSLPPDPAYLKPRDGMIIITDRVAALAERLAGPGTAPIDALRAFWNFCLDEFRQSGVHYDQVDWEAPGDWVLDSGWGDCQIVGALFCALCRARGIPARLMGGNYLYRACPTNHFWAEAWIDGQGWLPFDFLCWELSAGGQDVDWRDFFFGRLDARLITHCLPFDFTGSAGVPLPPAWHLLQWANGPEVAVSMLDIDARPLYTDYLTVTA